MSTHVRPSTCFFTELNISEVIRNNATLEYNNSPFSSYLRREISLATKRAKTVFYDYIQ